MYGQVQRSKIYNSGAVYWIAVVVVCAVWGASLLSNLFNSIGFDSASYLAATRFVLQGQVPYHDFFFFQPPVFLYAYAAFMKVAGFGWFQAKLLSVLFGLGSLVLLFAIAAKQRGKAGALLAIAIAGFSYPMVLHLGYYYLIAPGVFFLLLAVYADLCLSKRYVGIALATGAMMLAIGTRASYGPIIVWYFLYLLIVERKRYQALLTFAMSFVVALVVIWGYFLILDFPRTFFGVTAEASTMFPMWGYGRTVLTFLGSLVDDVARYPLVHLPILAIVIVEFIKHRGSLLGIFRKVRQSRFYLLVGGLYAVVPIFSRAASPYHASHHQIYYLPLGVLLVAIYFADKVMPHIRGDRVGQVIPVLLVLWLVMTPFMAGDALDALKELRHRQHVDFAEVVAWIERLTPPDGQVLAFTPLFPVLAERSLVHGLESSYVGFTPGWDVPMAKYYHVFNAEMMLEWVKCKQADLVVITDKDRLAFRNTIFSVGPQMWDAFETELESNYHLVKVIDLDDDYWGKARFYTPRSGAGIGVGCPP